MKNCISALILICCLSLLGDNAQCAPEENAAAALRIDSQISVESGDNVERELMQIRTVKDSVCYCEQRAQVDQHRTYCFDDKEGGEGCEADTMPVDFSISYFEAKIVREDKAVATGGGFNSVTACHEFLARYPGCRKL